MKRKTHKVVLKESSEIYQQPVFVGSEKECNQFMNYDKKENNYIVVPLSKESFKYKLVNEDGKLIFQNTEQNCYISKYQQYGIDISKLKVVLLTEEESEFYKSQNLEIKS